MTDLFQASAPLAQGATLGDQVTEVLRHNVVSGAWPVGSMLPSETTLAQDLDVSRTVVREAVSRLKAEGMLSSQQGRGAFVSSDRPQMGFAIDKQDVESLRKLSHILELRMGLEIEAAAFAAERATDAHRAEIEAAADMFDNAETGASGVSEGRGRPALSPRGQRRDGQRLLSGAVQLPGRQPARDHAGRSAEGG